MGNSRNSLPRDELTAALEAALGPRFGEGSRLCVGFSGGVDSVVLLDALGALAPRRRWELQALHVHHGLNPRADAWQRFCERFCAERTVPLQVARVEVIAQGEGLEAAARTARYEAFAGVTADAIVLAHHAGDQAETMLLNLIRGSGLDGAAGMPPMRMLAQRGPPVVRPLLGVSRERIEAYARQGGLTWIDDDSNADTRYARNALRHRVLPVLESIHPGAARGLSRSARLLAEQAGLVDVLAQLDAQAARDGAGWSIARLRLLGTPRAHSALRWILGEAGVRPPSAARLSELWRQLSDARRDASPAVRVRKVLVRRYRGILQLTAAEPLASARAPIPWDGSRPWTLPGLHGAIHFETMDPGTGAGVLAEEWVRPGRLSVRARAGGERLRPPGANGRRTLKNLFQEHAVPPWVRAGAPLVYVDDALAWVPGVGPDAAFAARAGSPGCSLRWVPDAEKRC